MEENERIWKKNERTNERTKKEKAMKKKGPKGFLYPPPRLAQKLIFYIRTVKRNLNETVAQKKSDFEPQTKEKKKKEKDK